MKQPLVIISKLKKSIFFSFEVYDQWSRERFYSYSTRKRVEMTVFWKGGTLTYIVLTTTW